MPHLQRLHHHNSLQDSAEELICTFYFVREHMNEISRIPTGREFLLAKRKRTRPGRVPSRTNAAKKRAKQERRLLEALLGSLDFLRIPGDMPL